MPEIKESSNNENNPPISEKKSLNVKIYFKTLASIFTDKKTRGEFKSFLKEKFKGS